jgi:DnaJ-class molecular chaperone
VKVNCRFCEGSGITFEEHGYGLVEMLGCPDCQGTGKVEGDLMDALMDSLLAARARREAKT